MRLASILVMVLTATLQWHYSDSALIKAPADVGLNPEVQRHLRDVEREEVAKDGKEELLTSSSFETIMQHVLKTMPIPSEMKVQLDAFIESPENKKKLKQMVNEALENPEKLNSLMEKFTKAAKANGTGGGNTFRR